MPRIKLLRKNYVLADLQDYIVGERKRKHITQAMMAEKLDLTQQTYSNHEKKMDFNASQLMTIFLVLDTDEAKIGRMLKL